MLIKKCVNGSTASTSRRRQFFLNRIHEHEILILFYYINEILILSYLYNNCNSLSEFLFITILYKYILVINLNEIVYKYFMVAKFQQNMKLLLMRGAH